MTPPPPSCCCDKGPRPRASPYWAGCGQTRRGCKALPHSPPSAQLYTEKIILGGYAAVGAFAIGFFLFIYVRSADIRMHSETNYYGVIGGPLSFSVGTDPDKILEIADTFMAQHARVWGLDWAGLESMDEITTTSVRDGLFCGDHKLYISGHYVVVHKVEKFLGLCFESESYEAFPLPHSTFLEYSNAGRNIGWFLLWVGICTGFAAIQGSASLQQGIGLGAILGFIHWFSSGKQRMTFGIKGGFAITCRVPYGLENPANLALDIVKPLFPSELQHELDNSEEPIHEYKGYLPDGSNARDAGGLALAIIKLPITLIKLALDFLVNGLCYACGRAGNEDAIMRVYKHHVTTHTNQALVICWTARYREGMLYNIVKNLFGWSDTYYISVLRNIPVVRCTTPGLSGPFTTFVIGVMLAVIVSGVGYVTGEQIVDFVAAGLVASFTLLALLQLFTRDATVYLGEEEQQGYTARLTREFHHVKFNGLGQDPDELVADINKVQSISISRTNAAIAGAASKA